MGVWRSAALGVPPFALATAVERFLFVRLFVQMRCGAPEELTVKQVSKAVVTLLFVWGCSLNAFAQEALLYITIEMPVKPGMSSEFVELMTEAAPDTRSFDGCRYFAILVDRDDPDRVLFYEIWESREQLDAYRAWRNESNFGDKMTPLLAGPPTTRYYALASE